MKKGIVATEMITGATELEAIAKMKTKVKPQIEAVEAVAVDAPEPELPQTMNLTVEQLQAAIAHATTAAVEQSTAQMQALNTQLAADLKAAEAAQKSLEQVFKVLGHPTPSAENRSRSSASAPQGLARDFVQACESAPTRIWIDKSTGQRTAQRDMSQARYLFHTEREQLRHDVEQLVKQNGFLQGGGYLASDAPVVKSDILPSLLDYMSMVMRETHSARYVYWQFPLYSLELGKGPGDVIQIPRLRWLTEAATVSDRTLTPGTALNAGNNPIQAFSVSITLAERGLGLNGGFPPVAVPEFFTAYSMLNLENAVMSRLGHDYESWEDLSIRSLFFASTRIVYNDRGSVATLPASVGTLDDGTMTEQFLNVLYAYMSGLQISSLDDGNYMLVLHDTALAQLKNSMATRNRYLDKTSVQELTGLLQAAANRERGKTSGYVGTIGNFHVFGTNAHSMGAPGTPGSQTETLGVGATQTRTSFAFGRAATARAIGMEAEVRRDDNDDFGRLNRYTWLSHETTGYLDVDPAIAAEQQLRVVQIRTTDISV